MCDMTHSYVWHDSFICVTWLIHMIHDSFVRVTGLIHGNMTGLIHGYMTWLIHMYAMTHSYVTWLIHMRHDLFIHDMSHLYATWCNMMQHDAFKQCAPILKSNPAKRSALVTWLIDVGTWHCSFKKCTPKIHLVPPRLFLRDRKRGL